MSRRVLVGFAGLVLLLAGCTSSSGSAAADPLASLPTDPPKECSVLTSKQVSDLAGSPMDPVAPAVGAGFTVCQWAGTGGLAVAVINTRADQWVTQLPSTVDGLSKSGVLDTHPAAKAKLADALALLAKGQSISSATSCALFSTILELRGDKPGTVRSVFLFPDATNPQAIVAQSCVDERFISVSLFTSGVTGAADELGRVSSALRQAEAAATSG
jgi:hypothetical protein